MIEVIITGNKSILFLFSIFALPAIEIFVKYGQVIASGNRQESTIDQLKWPSDVIIDKEKNSLIERVVR